MSLGVSAVHIVLSYFLSGSLSITMIIFGWLIHAGANLFLSKMSRPTIGDNGAILDSGVDLNMEGGFAEHIKDIVILTAGTQIASILSNWFWFLLLLAPGRAFHLLWGSVIKPYFFGGGQEEPENSQANEKKQKKMERRMKRVNVR